MLKKLIFDNILGKKKSEVEVAEPSQAESTDGDGVVEHLWMTQNDQKKAKKAVKSEPKVDTAIMRNRIAEKIAKLNNH